MDPSQVFGARIRNVDSIYRAGRDNANADALSRQLHLPAPPVSTIDDDAQVLSIEASDVDISSLLELKPELITSEYNSRGFSEEQKKDEEILSMIQFQQEKILPEDTASTRRIAAQAPMFTMFEEILYYLDDCPQCAIVSGTGRKSNPPLKPIPRGESISDCRSGYNGATQGK